MIYKEDVKDVYERTIKRDSSLSRNEIISIICKKNGVVVSDKNREKVRKMLNEILGEV